MKVLKSLLLILLAISYLFSGYTKLIPIEYFENDLLAIGGISEHSVLFISRLIIGSEFVIGFFLLFRLFLKPTLKVSLSLLTVYTFYLFYLLVVNGNEGNCGCYGQEFELTPLQGILKNILIAVISIYLYKSLSSRAPSRKITIIFWSLGLLALFSPFVIYKIDLPERVVVDGQTKERIKLEILYNTSDTESPPFELREGKTIIAFMSLKCYKCKMAANKLELIKRQYPQLPIYFIINGEEEDFDSFKKMSELRDVPYTFFNDGEELIKICGVNFPAIFLSNDSYLDASLNYSELTADNLLQWISN
jgi:glutaredoxin